MKYLRKNTKVQSKHANGNELSFCGPKGFRKFLYDLNHNKFLLFLASPVLIWCALFCYVPMFGIVLAFKDFDYSLGIFGSPWNGLKNFEFLFKTDDAWIITRNTVCYNLVWIPLGIICAVFLAILFDALSKKKVSIVNKTNQTLSLLPYFLSWVVVGYFIDTILNVDKGLINQIRMSLGMEKINWYSDTKYWPVILTLVNQWKNIGYSSIIYYSTIRGFSVEYYEAAKVDGASWFQQVRYITIPLMIPIITIMGIMAIGGIMNSDFGLFYIIPKNSGALYPVTNTLDTYIYNAMTTGSDLAVTGAVNFYKAVVGFALILITNSITRKISAENALF